MSRLDVQQRGAVETEAKRVLVVSVPGSGKTTTLVARIRHMVDVQHVSENEIVAITFTRLAAREIRSRLGSSARSSYVGTLHAFCLRMLTQFGEQLGYDPRWWSVVSDEEVGWDMMQTLADLGHVGAKAGGGWNWKDFTSEAWDDFVMRYQSGLTVDPVPAGDVVMKKAFDAYLNRLRASNTVTYGTMLLEALRLLEDRKVLVYWRRMARHILLDEAQDTSSVQWSIVWRLVEKSNPDTLFVVGDDDQSIYAWRGAAPDVMVGMATKEGVEVHRLENCYRFGSSIGDPARRLVEHNAVRIDKSLHALGTSGDVCILRAVTCEEVAIDISKRVVSDGVDPSSIAVLGRTHGVLDHLQHCLRDASVPCRKIGKLNALKKTSEFRTVMGLVRLMHNQADVRAVMQCSAFVGMSTKDVLEVREAVFNGSAPSLPAAASGLIAGGLENLMISLPRDFGDVTSYLSTTCYLHGLNEPRQLLEWIALSDQQDEFLMGNDKGVTLATAHAAKGLEWPIVYVVGMNDGLWPGKASVREGRMDEERRLAYVAWTRARESLTLVTLRAEPDDMRRLRCANLQDGSMFMTEAGW